MKNHTYRDRLFQAALNLMRLYLPANFPSGIDVFISYRMGEAKTEAELLKNALLKRGVHTYMSWKQIGNNAKQDVVHALNAQRRTSEAG